MSKSRIPTAPAVDPEEFVEELVRRYPAKVAKKRRRHILVRDPSEPQSIEANVRTVPGIITQRGCCYAGCKGVVIGPIGDMVHITHGPIGCGYYSWLTRRNLFRPRADGANFLHYCFSTDMQEEDIIFGGEKKLREAIREAVELFRPKAVSVHATCPVGLIGDDVQAVAREMEEELGVPVLAFHCEGYKGVSQSAGHHIANNNLFKAAVGRDDLEPSSPFAVNILGEYNIGGDAWEIERVLERCGIRVWAVFSGNGSIDDIRRAHTAQLNLVMCHRSINYMAEMMEKAYGIPWVKVNFIGVRAMAKSLRKIVAYFEDPDLSERVERVIADEVERAERDLAPYRERLAGKTVVLFVGGSRAHHYQDLFRDLGMRTIAAGYEFAHRDDYEGRHILPTLKMDADSRNIEELKVGPHPEKYRPRLPAERAEELRRAGLIDHYEGMLPDMEPGSLVIDDISHLELEMLIKRYRPDLVCSGIKDKYVIEKFGVPSKQLHNYDYRGPYAGFRGAVNFARDIDSMIHSPVWKLVRPPWEKEPCLRAELTA
ncbi:nitrogenase molybdenum-iron protein alpha chain [Desulfacinum infernum DSM 9756]|uniref:Nitrogenase protein alpha chain n=1 Tax=Desulfacinum infernum DSM 9756 TaxID=1121391 RepID=A0A1M5HTV3_9BACT|nr:nitrogenase molybdenum-iron protein alpha chain [Desulfacinum infernum]SHG19363.1 nitrogenase molybdenum-iron protein alpha chain [Desulfacinum infernum DSM 9756]